MLTLDFNGIDFSEFVVTSNEKCEKHGENKAYLSFPSAPKTPICPICTKASLEQRNRDLEIEGGQQVLRFDSYDWLRTRSILTDRTLRKASFDTFVVDTEEERHNKQQALEMAKLYVDGARFNCVMSGNAGAGKSHLAMSMLKVINANSQPYKRCLFVSLDELMRLIKDSFNNRQSLYTEEAMTRLLVKADVLVVDDLGAEIGAMNTKYQASDWIQKVLYAITNGRMDKPTIYTTNLTGNQMLEKYDKKLISRMLRGSKGHTLTFKNTNDKRLEMEF